MTDAERERIRKASYLLPDPGGEVVRDLLDALAIPEGSVVVRREEVQLMDWAFDQVPVPIRRIVNQNEYYYDKYAETLATLRRLAAALAGEPE